MRRFAFSPLTVILALALVTTAPQQSAPVAAQATPTQQAPIPQPPPPAATADPVKIPLNLFKVPEGLEVTVWAETPLLRNPTNIDIDRDGRIWVAEGVRYRSHHARQPEGDKIVVLQDKDGDGKAESSHTFVQEPGLIAPLGVSVIDNKIVVAQPPDLIVYTDVDRNLRFDPAVDKREVLLTGFHGVNHDHSLHSVTVGPDGKWVFNAGNTGGMFTDKSGKTFRVFGQYRPGPVGPFKYPHDAAAFAGKPSDDGHVYVGGFTVRMNPDGTKAEIIGHNYRNSYEQSVTSLGDVFQNDNDDPPACRVSWVMEYANFGFSSNDGQRSWQADRRPGQSTPVAEWRQDDPGMTPIGRRLRRRLADRQRLLRKRRARVAVRGHVPRGRCRPQRDLLVSAGARRRRLRAAAQDLRDLEREAGVRGVGLRHGPWRRCRPRQGHRDDVPPVRRRRRSRRRDLRQRLDRPARRRPPGSRQHDVGRDLSHRAEGLHLEGADVRYQDGRRTDHGAALAGGERPRHRLRRV